MENFLYIPINSSSLAHYFSKAIILPAKYFANKPEDIQNMAGDCILVSLSKWVKNSDCTLEIIFTDKELTDLNRVSEHFYFCNTPIPISRVKSVCFLDSKQKETTMWNINNGAAFIPERIVSVENTNIIESASVNEIKNSQEFNLSNDLSDKIKRFDIILGGFAFMRLGSKSFTNYSTNYFATLSYFNELIEKQLSLVAVEKGLKFSNKFIGLFSKIDSEWTKWLKSIYQNLEPADIELLAKNEGVRIEKKLGLLKLDSINPNSHLYELAILATYGDGKSKSTDNLVADLTNGTIYEQKVEDVSILFGLNNGYSKLRNKYKGSVKQNNVKFTLESKLDYYTIESVFQFAFNGIKSNNSFEYIDSWCPSNKMNNKVKGFETFKILDTVVIAKKKPTPVEEFLEKYAPNIYLTIGKSINQWIPPFLKIDEKEATHFFENLLRSNLTISVEAIEKNIESEYEESYNLLHQESNEAHKIEIDRLLAEISKLKEDNIKIKNITDSQPVVKRQKVILPKSKEYEIGSFYKSSNIISVVQEPTEMITNEDYSSLTITDLKKIAKTKGISDITLKGYKKENKYELIALITKTPTQPKML